AVHRAERAALDEPPRFPKPGIESPLEADLHLSVHALDVLDDRLRRVEVERDRLLTEDREARVEAAMDERRVRAGRRDDDRGVGTLECRVDRGGARESKLGGDRARPGLVRVVDAQLRDARELSQHLGVERAEPAEPQDSYPHVRATLD